MECEPSVRINPVPFRCRSLLPQIRTGALREGRWLPIAAYSKRKHLSDPVQLDNLYSWLSCLLLFKNSFRVQKNCKNSFYHTLAFALPSNDDNTINGVLSTEIHHPDGMIYKVVVKNSAAMKICVSIAVDGQGSSAILPVLPQVSLVVQPSRSMESEILFYI
jgi:hypothetical protein